MCGIFGLFNYTNHNLSNNFIGEQSQKAQHRGPDSYKISLENNIFLAFYRLAINGLDKRSDQPLKYNNKVLICNGEIYNYKKLYKMMNIIGISNSDCEIIIHLYEKYGIEYTVNALDGVFSFILIDYEIGKAFISRDPFGIRPLFMLCAKDHKNNNLIGFSSEMKQLHEFTNNHNNYNGSDLDINPFLPGQFLILNFSENIWSIENITTYFSFNLVRVNPDIEEINEEIVTSNIHDIFCEAIFKRVTTTDRPIACLLSG